MNKKESALMLANSVFFHVRERVATAGGLFDEMSLFELRLCLPQWFSGSWADQHLLDAIDLLTDSGLVVGEDGVAEEWQLLKKELAILSRRVAKQNEQLGGIIARIDLEPP